MKGTEVDDMQKIKTLLMFDGNAEEAMNFYTSLFGHSEIRSIARYNAGEPGAEGTVKHAVFTLNGQEYRCIDSAVKHAFTFTAAMSLFVDCASEQEIPTLFHKLSEGGQVFMPLAAYPFSRMFGWVSDRYGVSWQLNLS